MPYTLAARKDSKIYIAFFEDKLEEEYGLVYRRTYYNDEGLVGVYNVVFKVTNEKRFLLAALRENISFKEEEE